MKIKGIENMTYRELTADIDKGGKFVMFTYTISIVVMTFRRPIKKIYYIKSDESPIKYGYSSLLISLFLGWWGLPFGPIYTIQSIIRAFIGIDITDEVMNSLEKKVSINAKISTPGRLRLPNGNYVFNLSEGRNIIGRAANSSNATIQLSAGDSRKMSREHLVIDVCKRPNGYIHSVSLYKEGLNKTSINNKILNYGDSVILNDGDMINLPNVSIVFENR